MNVSFFSCSIQNAGILQSQQSGGPVVVVTENETKASVQVTQSAAGTWTNGRVRIRQGNAVEGPYFDAATPVEFTNVASTWFASDISVSGRYLVAECTTADGAEIRVDIHVRLWRAT